MAALQPPLNQSPLDQMGNFTQAWSRFFTLLSSGAIGAMGGPTLTTALGAPTSAQPLGSLYVNASGAVGATLYVSRGGGTWNAVAGV